MGLGMVRRAVGSRPLLPASLRRPGTALLAACVAVVTALAVLLAGRGSADRLNAALDPRIQAWLARYPSLLHQLPRLGGLPEVALMTLGLALVGVATRQWTGAVLALVAVPAAVGLTEYVLKPYVGGPLGQAFPSGHATSSFALAAIWAILLADPPRPHVPRALRLLLVIVAFVLAAAVAAAMVAEGAHTFTDAVAGAAVGTGVVLACTLMLDLVASRARGPGVSSPDRPGDHKRTNVPAET